MAEIIVTEGLSFSYEGHGHDEVLKKIDLTINAGEYVAIVGTNGSGKSTLLRHFNALLTPTQGDVRVGDFYSSDPENTNKIRQICGMVFQNPDNQIVATTVEEDVAFGPENLMLTPDEIRERVVEAMNIARISSLAGKAPHLLSGGEKQLVAIAGVLAMNPSCLLLDEVTSYLDPGNKEMVLNLIDELNKREGITVVHITHSMEEAAAARRILLMSKGRIIADGPPGIILTNAKLLQENGLELPLAASLAEKLRSCGMKLPDSIISLNELAEVLCS